MLENQTTEQKKIAAETEIKQSATVIDLDSVRQKKKKEEKKSLSHLYLESLDQVFDRYEKDWSVIDRAITELRNLYHIETCPEIKLSYLKKILSMSGDEETDDWVSLKIFPYLDEIKSPGRKLDMKLSIYKNTYYSQSIRDGIRNEIKNYFKSKEDFAPLYSILNGYHCRSWTVACLASLFLEFVDTIPDKILKMYFLMCFLKRKSVDEGVRNEIREKLFSLMPQEMKTTPEEIKTQSWSDLIADKKDSSEEGPDISNVIHWEDLVEEKAKPQVVKNEIRPECIILPFPSQTD